MNNKIHGIYSISNKINGKSYIGSSCDIIRRWRHHKQNLNKGIHHCIYLQRAWNKYGKNNFVFHIEAKCTKDNLISLEQSFLDKAKLNRKQYYNSTYHAGGQEPKNVTKKQNPHKCEGLSCCHRNQQPVTSLRCAQLSYYSL